MVKDRTRGLRVTSSIPVPIKIRRVGQRCMINLSRAETSCRWCGVIVRRGWCQLKVSLSSLDHGSELRGSSPIVLESLKSATLIISNSRGVMWKFGEWDVNLGIVLVN
ncbi:hypothetical protein TNCV_4703261 [Trichonephila clavipes]|nr:hypothetical protein TNCV_4703261 [Trichonephila clavipes]